MIRVRKPAEAPEVLETKGKEQTERLTREYDASPADYDSRAKKFSFDSGLYGHATVKAALVLAQRKKCCFCESKVGMDGDVEHYRPKAGFSQAKGSPIEGPGYYWLAYTWANLLLACAICNQRFKRSLFPLFDPARRARSHHDDVGQEDPLFINPAETDPEQYISFRREIPYAVGGSPHGQATIDALGLGREILNERRRDRLQHLATLHELVTLENESAPPDLLALIEKAKPLLADAVTADAEFAAMARAAARANYYLN